MQHVKNVKHKLQGSIFKKIALNNEPALRNILAIFNFAFFNLHVITGRISHEF